MAKINPCDVTLTTRILVLRELGLSWAGLRLDDVRILWVAEKEPMIYTFEDRLLWISKDWPTRSEDVDVRVDGKIKTGPDLDELLNCWKDLFLSDAETEWKLSKKFSKLITGRLLGMKCPS